MIFVTVFTVGRASPLICILGFPVVRTRHVIFFSAGVFAGFRREHTSKMVDSSESLCFTTALRGFHVYSTTVGWKPYIHQNISFKREHNNCHDKFAVAGLALLPGKLSRDIVGHVPRELSRYVLFAMEKGAEFTGKVISDKRKRSPLLQGGLEIPISITVKWTTKKENMAILKAKVDEVAYNIDIEYVDDSKSILSQILEDTESVVSSDDDLSDEDEDKQ